VGYLRWYNERERKWLRFDDLEMDLFVDAKTLSVDREALLRALRNRSKSLVVETDEELWRRVRAMEDAGHDLWHVCCGHDLVRILSVALRQVLGANKPSDVTPASVEEKLRLAYSAAHFRVTWLRAAIVDWEGRNPPYAILAREDAP
jgi:hypothetical protein